MNWMYTYTMYTVTLHNGWTKYCVIGQFVERRSMKSENQDRLSFEFEFEFEFDLKLIFFVLNLLLNWKLLYRFYFVNK